MGNRPKQIIFLILLLGIDFILSAQEKISLSGYIMDEASKETLIGANIFELNSKKGVVANNFGFYSLSLEAGEVIIRVSYVGYQPDTLYLTLKKDTVMNLKLKPSSHLQEVVIESSRGAGSNVENTELGTISLTPQMINAVPAILGEVDLIKVLQQMPGVSAGTEGFSGLYVRGGNKDENLYLLDGNPLYDVNHLFGFISTFNPDAIKSTEFYKGSFPARYGGRLSSVVDLRTKDGDMENYHGNISIGLISAKAQVEGPIVKNKASFNVSFRRTYLDLLTTPLFWIINSQYTDEKVNANYHFYDLNAKLNYKFSEKSRLYFNLYSGEDAVKMKQESSSSYSYYNTSYDDQMQLKWRWGNFLTSLNWNYVFSPKLFGTFSGIYSRYHSKIALTDESTTKDGGKVINYDYTESHYNSGIQDIGYRMDFDYIPHHRHTIRFGSNYLYHTFIPEESGSSSKYSYENEKPQGDTIVSDSKRLYGNEFSLYVEDDMEISARLKANIGLHLSLFNADSKTYTSLQPRVSLRYLMLKNFSVKASYAMMSQYVHLLSSSAISLPTDLWVPVTGQIQPMISHQVSAGLYYTLKKQYEFSIEGYYKIMENLIEYKDGSSMFSSSTDWQKRVAIGEGTSYGVEFLAQRTIGKITGWVGYGLSWTDRRFPDGDINNGKSYWAKYDNRNKINVVCAYKINKKMDVNASWTYYTGNRMTVALESYYAPIDLPGSNNYNFYEGLPETPYYESRNNYKMSNYHRLDVGFNFYKPKKKERMAIWNVSIYNAYCHLNPMFAVQGNKYVEENGALVSKPVITEYSIFPIIPSFSYTYKF